MLSATAPARIHAIAAASSAPPLDGLQVGERTAELPDIAGSDGGRGKYLDRGCERQLDRVHSAQ
jgi:hypothetical protein